MTPIRVGAVGYLNARPLTWALDRDPGRWLVRYDVPAVCADLLRAGDVDLGLTPSVEFLSAPDYRFVPGVGIGSDGPVASVALYARVPLTEDPAHRARHQLADVGGPHPHSLRPPLRDRAGLRRSRP